MANLTQSQIPSTALPAANGTLEQLLAWTVLAMRSMTGTDASVEINGEQSQPVVQTNIFTDAAGRQRLVLRVNLELEADYVTNSAEPLWGQVTELVTGDLPAPYTA